MALKALVCIETDFQNGKTVLRKSFCHSPFKIADATEDKSTNGLQLMIMSSSPGVLDGDDYSFEIKLGSNSSLHIATQSYQRIFQMEKGATQRMNVYLGEGASLSYLPHPLVPHQRSIFSSKSKIHLTGSCCLLWGEVISCGRKLNGEIFEFSSYHSVTEIYCQEKLLVKENLLLLPKTMNVQGIGHLEGFTHQATMIYINEHADLTGLMDEVLVQLKMNEEIEYGVTELPVKGFIVRLLGYKAEQLFHILKQLALLIKSTDVVEMKNSKAHVV